MSVNYQAYLEKRILDLWEQDEKISYSGDIMSSYAGEVRGRLLEAIHVWDMLGFGTSNERINTILDWYHQWLGGFEELTTKLLVMYYVFVYKDGEYSQQSVAFQTEEEAVRFKNGMTAYGGKIGVSYHIFKMIGWGGSFFKDSQHIDNQ